VGKKEEDKRKADLVILINHIAKKKDSFAKKEIQNNGGDWIFKGKERERKKEMKIPSLHRLW